MIDINTPSYPANKPRLFPNKMVIDAGFTDANFKALMAVSPKDVVLALATPDFDGFFKLYDHMKIKNPKIRDHLPEFGYSPYNLMLLINSLGLHKQDFATLIGCSFSKVLANTTHRCNSYFRPLVGNQWQDLLYCYSQMIKSSDLHYGDCHHADKLFFMSADKSLPLSIPSSTQS